jgi:hypothetical protein
MLLAVIVGVISPDLWQENVGNGIWLPIRGFINGNSDRGVAALFPLAPWFAFSALGSSLGVFYRQLRVVTVSGRAQWSEAKWLVVITIISVLLCLWSSYHTETWLANRHWTQSEQSRLHNMTLPSIIQRFSIVCMIGSFLCWIESIRMKLPGPNIIKIASYESLLIYVLHLTMVFGILLADPIKNYTNWQPYNLDWPKTIAITIAVISINIVASIQWNQLPGNLPQIRKLKKIVLATISAWIICIAFGASQHYPFM